METFTRKKQYPTPSVKDGFLCRRDVPAPTTLRPRARVGKPKVSTSKGLTAVMLALFAVPLFVYDDTRPEKATSTGGQSWNKSPDYTVSRTPDTAAVQGIDGATRVVSLPCIPYLSVIRANYYGWR